MDIASSYETQQVRKANPAFLRSIYSYEKRKKMEQDRLTIREIEKSIKDGIKDKLVEANKQRQVWNHH